MIKKWWHGMVAYQIYPKSFMDSNGDGIGDIKGIITKLDYLKDLGVDIIWLSPIFSSPFADQGYDISDYYNIDKRFGSMEDFEELLAEAKKRDMYILMDLVVNHCSDEHEWFKKACEDPDGEYGKYFYIRDYDGEKLPTNWRAYFGGPVWDILPGHNDKVYLHVFHKKQPDLNWENPVVREEVYKMVNWWLDKGLGGFRIDAIINIKKPEELHDYPVDRLDGLCSIKNMLDEATGVGVFLQELKKRTFEPHDAFSVGEVFDSKGDELLEFIGNEKGHFSSMFDFSTTIIGASKDGWQKNTPVTPEQYIQALYDSQKNIGNNGFFSNIIENHDEPRGVSRYIPAGELTIEGKKMLGLIAFMVRGLPFIYQGQEIGMENCQFDSIDEIDDISSIDQYQVAIDDGLTEKEALEYVNLYSRDNARTPMQWNDTEGCGFTTGKPWLKINPKYKTINVESQINDQNSVLSFYKKLTALRKSDEYKDTIVYGTFEPYTKAETKVMSFLRKGENQTIFVAANYKPETDTVIIPGKVKSVLINNTNKDPVDGDVLKLSGYQAVVIVLE